MAQNNNGLPEGTDTVIEGGGAGGSGGGSGRSGTSNQGGSPSTGTNATGARTSTTASESQTDSLITATTASSGTSGSTGTTGSTGTSGSSTGTSSSAGTSGSSTGTTGSTSSTSTGSDSSSSDGSSNSGGIRGIVSNVSTKARDEATNRARGFVGDGLKSGSATLGNIAGIIEETVEQISERLGPQYADYARTASQTINRYASSLESKDPDELVDDVRDLIRKSPGVAVTGAAIIGFGLVRLLKAGIPEESSDGIRNRQSDRTGSTR
jgi:hypothetical protein